MVYLIFLSKALLVASWLNQHLCWHLGWVRSCRPSPGLLSCLCKESGVGTSTVLGLAAAAFRGFRGIFLLFSCGAIALQFPLLW